MHKSQPYRLKKSEHCILLGIVLAWIALAAVTLAFAARAGGATITIQTDDGRVVQVKGDTISVDGQLLPATQPSAIDLPAGTPLTSATFAKGKAYNLHPGKPYPVQVQVELPDGVTLQGVGGRAILDGGGGGCLHPQGAVVLRGLRLQNMAGNAINGNAPNAAVKHIEDVEVVSVRTVGEDSAIWAEGCNWQIKGLRFIGRGYAVRFYGFAYANDGTHPDIAPGPNSITDSFALTVDATGAFPTTQYRVHGQADAQTILSRCEAVYRVGKFDLSKALADPVKFYDDAKKQGQIPENWNGVVIAPNGGGDAGRPGEAKWQTVGVRVEDCRLDGCSLKVGTGGSVTAKRLLLENHGDAIFVEDPNLPSSFSDIAINSIPIKGSQQGSNAFNGPGASASRGTSNVLTGDPKCDIGAASGGFVRVPPSDARLNVGFRA